MMSRKITLSNEQISSFLKTDDALKALSISVDNSQIRLALQVLVEIINDLNSSISALEEKASKTVQEQKVVQEKPAVKEKVEKTTNDSENK